MTKTGFFFSLLCLLAVLLLPASGLNAASLQAPKSLPQNGIQVQPPAAASGAVDIKDIYGPETLAAPPNYLLWSLIVCGIIVVVLGLFFYMKRRPQKAMPTIDPATRALAELQDAEDTLAETGATAFAHIISHLLRVYIEQTFQIRSTRQTTGEFFSHLQEHNQSAFATVSPLGEHHQALHHCLTLCDEVKFAHYEPDDHTSQSLANEVRLFIEATRPMRTEPE